MKLLYIENHSELINKVKELKHYTKKSQKDRKLVVNLQKMVKDYTQGSMGTIIPIADKSTIQNHTLKSTRNIQNGNSTIDISSLTNNGGFSG